MIVLGGVWVVPELTGLGLGLVVGLVVGLGLGDVFCLSARWW